MWLYSLLSLVCPRSLPAKLLLIVLGVGIGPGLSALVATLRLREAEVGFLLSVAGGGLCAGVLAAQTIYAMLAPVWRTADALEAHARGWPVRPLPDGHRDELGVLMRRANAALTVAEWRLDESRRQAEIDPLTGALNRRGFDRAMTGAPGGAVIVCDLDHFKAVNDRYGHEAGDKVLRRAASAWRRALREGDLLARIGGEEFVVYLPRATLATAARRANELRTGLSREVSVSGRAVTASFGVAARRAGRPVDEAIERADEALYRAKRTGRNRVCLDGIETPPPPEAEAEDGRTAAPDAKRIGFTAAIAQRLARGRGEAAAPVPPPCDDTPATEARAMLR